MRLSNLNILQEGLVSMKNKKSDNFEGKWHVNKMCYQRKYKTRMSIQEILIRLKTKNIYDLFKYRFEETGTDYFIVLIQSRGIPEYRYRITFRAATDDTTEFEINLCKTLFGLGFYDTWLDMFFAQKVDAASFG